MENLECPVSLHKEENSCFKYNFWFFSQLYNANWNKMHNYKMTFQIPYREFIFSNLNISNKLCPVRFKQKTQNSFEQAICLKKSFKSPWFPVFNATNPRKRHSSTTSKCLRIPVHSEPDFWPNFLEMSTVTWETLKRKIKQAEFFKV